MGYSSNDKILFQFDRISCLIDTSEITWDYTMKMSISLKNIFLLLIYKKNKKNEVKKF